MKTSRILTSVLYEPWAILPSAAEAFLPVLARWLKGEEVLFEERGKLEMGSYYGGFISAGYPEDIAEMPDGTIAIVSLKGEMTKYGGLCSYGTQQIGGLIKQLADSKNIAGGLIDMDGPGGSVNAIAPMTQAMQYFKSKGKVLGVHGDMVASAHLYAAVHGDFFMLDNTISSQAGSIGTMIQFADYRGYFEKEGIKLHTIYAPESTHKNIEFEKALEGDYSDMKEKVLSPLAVTFQEAVRTQRGGKLNEKAEGILNGAMFFATDAVANGLADGIGTLENALERVVALTEARKFMRKY